MKRGNIYKVLIRGLPQNRYLINAVVIILLFFLICLERSYSLFCLKRMQFLLSPSIYSPSFLLTVVNFSPRLGSVSLLSLCSLKYKVNLLCTYTRTSTVCPWTFSLQTAFKCKTRKKKISVHVVITSIFQSLTLPTLRQLRKSCVLIATRRHIGSGCYCHTERNPFWEKPAIHREEPGCMLGNVLNSGHRYQHFQPRRIPSFGCTEQELSLGQKHW